MQRAVPAVLVPGRHPEPRRARDARLDPRGRRARLRARARLRRRVRQPRPARLLRRRRRRGRDRPARDELALEQVPRTRARDGAVLPILHLNGYKIANPTVLARIPRGRARRRCSRATASGRSSSRVTTPRRVHERLQPRSTMRSTRSPSFQQRRARRRGRGPAALADDRPAHAEGLDRPEGGRRPARSRAPGARTRCRSPAFATTRSTCAQLEEWIAELPAGGAVRRRSGALVAELAALAPHGERRMSANPHANGGLLLRDLELPDFRDYAVAVERAGHGVERGDARARRLPARRHRAQPATTSASSGRTRPRRTGSARSSRSTARELGRRDPADRRSPRPGRPRDGGAVASTCARAGSRATCSPAATASSTATRRSSTSSTRCSTSTRSG